MDLRGYGDTFEAARKELMDLVQAQFSFAAFKKQPELVWHSAERKYWKMYEDAKRSNIERFSLNTPQKTAHQASAIAVPPAHLVAKLAKEPRVDA